MQSVVLLTVTEAVTYAVTYGECHKELLMMSVVMLSVIMLGVAMLSIVAASMDGNLTGSDVLSNWQYHYVSAKCRLTNKLSAKRLSAFECSII